MTNLFDRFPLKLRALLSRGSTTRRSGDRHTPLGSRPGGSLSRGYLRGLTLIEMLVALAVTLVMMAAVVNLFANISGSIRNRRAAIETGAQLRQVRQRLAMDLNGATCRGTTWQRPEANQGYIEIIEGQWNDKNPSILIDGNTGNGELDYAVSMVPSSQGFDSDTGNSADGRALGVGAITDARALGDWDDVLALTTQDERNPFTGKIPYLNPTTNAWEARFDDSPQAEVIWFAEQNGLGGGGNAEPGMRRIYRRALLVRPSTQFPPLSAFTGTTNRQLLNDYYTKYDVSARIEDGRLVGNTLSDLTKREYRFNHAFDPTVALSDFPHAMLNLPNGQPDWLVLNNALAFDLRIFDPGAPLVGSAGAVLEPSDLGWEAVVNVTNPPVVGYGAYCDLGWGKRLTAAGYAYPQNAVPALPLGVAPAAWSPIVPQPTLHMPHRVGWHPNPNTPATFVDYPAVYDTWSYHYENDGLNQDASATDAWRANTFDQGANGLDDDGANGVDDRGERETSPPYDVPLRGIKAILRVYEPDARQVRESSVTHSFQQ
ncbi:PilW family protein [Lacipirellula parvula]|uniref:Type II secretion system protein n=1 Tax=Lacipirellula parvula TaxID=2650471 RepID=A0A5K7XIB0_9BACT|nr:prepilin-type N-terminal cleavage/methylation domain-containing protein [Lacipirellula parvula]BBO34036.1 hypothetical protein PLANPX_3648 [Lacipirellula parvula]